MKTDMHRSFFGLVLAVCVGCGGADSDDTESAQGAARKGASGPATGGGQQSPLSVARASRAELAKFISDLERSGLTMQPCKADDWRAETDVFSLLAAMTRSRLYAAQSMQCASFVYKEKKHVLVSASLASDERESDVSVVNTAHGGPVLTGTRLRATRSPSVRWDEDVCTRGESGLRTCGPCVAAGTRYPAWTSIGGLRCQPDGTWQ